MLPDKVISTIPVQGNFLFPDNRPFNPFEDYELGGIAHQDPSQGLRVVAWTAYLNSDGWVCIRPTDGSRPELPIVLAPGARYLSLSFDQNMRVVLAWNLGGSIYLYWYDASTEGFVTTEFSDCRNPRLCHDDKRRLQTSAADVILAYLKNDSLYFRAQRDRFLTEYHLADIPKGLSLRRMGMADNNRVIFEFL